MNRKAKTDIAAIVVVVGLVVAWLTLQGCAGQLRGPSAEHAVQMQTLCSVGTDEAQPAYAADVCAAAKQACLLAAALRSASPSMCESAGVP